MPLKNFPAYIHWPIQNILLETVKAWKLLFKNLKNSFIYIIILQKGLKRMNVSFKSFLECILIAHKSFIFKNNIDHEFNCFHKFLMCFTFQRILAYVWNYLSKRYFKNWQQCDLIYFNVWSKKVVFSKEKRRKGVQKWILNRWWIICWKINSRLKSSKCIFSCF